MGRCSLDASIKRRLFVQGLKVLICKACQAPGRFIERGSDFRGLVGLGEFAVSLLWVKMVFGAQPQIPIVAHLNVLDYMVAFDVSTQDALLAKSQCD